MTNDPIDKAYEWELRKLNARRALVRVITVVVTIVVITGFSGLLLILGIKGGDKGSILLALGILGAGVVAVKRAIVSPDRYNPTGFGSSPYSFSEMADGKPTIPAIEALIDPDKP